MVFLPQTLKTDGVNNNNYNSSDTKGSSQKKDSELQYFSEQYFCLDISSL